MKKILSFALILVLFASFSSLAADKKFKDLPAKHWASKSVYDLVQLGVTSGYPDGTFRGNNKISRYEAAVMISKLSENLSAEDMETMRSDLLALKNELADLKKSSGAPITGFLEMDAKLASVLAKAHLNSRGPVMNYRLKTSMKKDLGPDASASINFDTMDAGFNGGNEDIASRLIDVEGNFRANLGIENPVDFKVTVGPGPQLHNDATGILSPEADVYYLRPDPAILAKTSFWGMGVEGGYIIPKIAASGKADVNRIMGKVSYDLTGLPMVDKMNIYGLGNYLVEGMAGKSRKILEVGGQTNLLPRIGMQARFGMGASNRSGWLVGATLKLNDVWDTGTNVLVSATKIGANHFDTSLAPYMAGYDVFDRALENASVNIEGAVAQAIMDKVVIEGKGVVRTSPDLKYGSQYSASRLTLQGGVSYNFNDAASVGASYRVLHNPTAVDKTTDMAKIGLLYNF